MDAIAGATGRGGVAGKHPIGMRYELGVARRKHGVFAQVGVGAGAAAATVESNQAE